MPTSGLVFLKWLGSIGWFLLPSPSSVASAGYSTPGPLCGVHLSGGDKDFCWCLHLGWFPGDRCCARTPDIVLSLIPHGRASAFWWDHLFSAMDTSRLSAAPDARSLQDPAKDPPLKSELQKVGSNSVPTAPEALPILHAPLPYSHSYFCHNWTSVHVRHGILVPCAICFRDQNMLASVISNVIFSSAWKLRHYL